MPELEHLNQIPGVGPRLAQKLVELFGSEEAAMNIITNAQVATLASIPGVGKKTAERVMLDLKDKLGVGLEFVAHPALTHADAEVIAALTSLGYSIAEAQAALRSLPQEDLPLEERIRLSLQYFGRE